MKKIKISKEVDLPLDAISQTFAQIGRKGAGKTYLASMIAEQMLEVNAQVIVIDPIGKMCHNAVPTKIPELPEPPKVIHDTRIVSRPPPNFVQPKEEHKEHKSFLINSDDNQEEIPNLCASKIYSFLYANQDKSFTKKQVCFMTGYSLSGSFNNALYWLSAKDLISLNKQTVTIKNLDENIATEQQEEFCKELFTKKLNKCARAIFEILWENNQQEYSKQELVEITGYSLSGSFNNAIYHLISLNFIDKRGDSIRLNPEILEL